MALSDYERRERLNKMRAKILSTKLSPEELATLGKEYLLSHASSLDSPLMKVMMNRTSGRK